MYLSHAQILFDHLFYGVIDVVFLILNIMALRIVRGTRWRAYLGWIVPYIWSCGLQIIYRTVVNAHYFLGIHVTNLAYSLACGCINIADMISLYGSVILLRTLRQAVNGTLPEGPKEQTSHVIEEGSVAAAAIETIMTKQDARMQKRTRKPENNFQKLHRYLFGSILNWCFFSLVHLDLNYRLFGFWGFVLMYSAGLALLDVVVGAWKDIADRMRQKRIEETKRLDGAQ